jgi:hypothetical protein
MTIQAGLQSRVATLIRAFPNIICIELVTLCRTRLFIIVIQMDSVGIEVRFFFVLAIPLFVSTVALQNSCKCPGKGVLIAEDDLPQTYC